MKDIIQEGFIRNEKKCREPQSIIKIIRTIE